MNAVFIALIVLAGACAQKQPLGRSDSISTAASIEAQTTVQTTAQATSEQKAVTSEVLEADDAIAEEPALEPVSIGGASLVCLYPQGQQQGSETYQLECQIKDPAEISAPILRAEFFKIDEQGKGSQLTVQSQDLNLFTWVLLEKVENIYLANIQMIIHTPNGTATLTTKVSILNLELAARFWLGGEPNNSVQAGEEEDCAEWQNLAAKQVNETASGLTNGPLGRLNDNQCSTIQRFICKNKDLTSAQKWMISTIQGAFQDYPKACPAGYHFAMPMTDAEAQSLNTFIDPLAPGVTKYWVPLHDRDAEGKFILLLN